MTIDKDQFAEHFHDKIVDLVNKVVTGDKPLMLPSDAARELVRAAADICLSGGLSNAETAAYIRQLAAIIESDAPVTNSKH